MRSSCDPNDFLIETTFEGLRDKHISETWKSFKPMSTEKLREKAKAERKRRRSENQAPEEAAKYAVAQAKKE
eukprot:2974574-Pleurochrysis_carterae.AAC.2